ncbi:MAG TPA: hypothetical protein VJ997_07200 [Longimicrobiales bacterium]|nr:hypothetical protein [Longimicrobiales bacterium]
MKTAQKGEAITLSGPPRNATANIQLDDASERVVPVAVKLADGPSVLRAYVRPYGRGTGEMRLRLPPDTPPGTYRGEAVMGKLTRAIVVAITAEHNVRVDPPQTSVRGAPGETVEFEIHLTNGGNVSLDVPKETAVELDDDRDQVHAFGRALRSKLDEGEHRVDRFFEELRESHGGQGRVTVLDGAGPLDPGGTRTLRCGLEIPDIARPGRTYTGGWEPAGGGHLLIVEVAEKSPDKPRVRARSKP